MGLFNKERKEIERLHRDDEYRKQTLRTLKEQGNVRKEVKTISKLRQEERGTSWWNDRPTQKKQVVYKKKADKPKHYGSPTPKIFFK